MDTFERVAVDKEALTGEIENINICLQNYSETAGLCVNALQAYCAENRITGAAYTNSQLYYEQTYIPLLNQLVCACDELIDVNNSILPALDAYISDTSGFAADTQVLEAEIERLKTKNNEYQSQIDYYDRLKNTTVIGIVLPSAYVGIICFYQGCIWVNNYTIDKLQKIVDGLRAFNSDCANMYQDSDILLTKLFNAVNRLNTSSVWNTENSRYCIPENIANDITAVNRRLLLRLGQSEEENEKIIAALFPGWEYKLAEAINCCPVGESVTVSDSVEIPFPDGSSITYERSAEIHSSSASVAEINLRLTDQTMKLNCCGVTFSENGISVPVATANIDNEEIKESFGVEYNYLYQKIFVTKSSSISEKCGNCRVTSAITVRRPIDEEPPNPVPSAVVPAAEPDPLPWFEKSWNWVCDTANTINEISNEINMYMLEAAVIIAVVAIWVIAIAEPTPAGEMIATALTEILLGCAII